MVIVFAGVGQGLDHQLQGADPIAIERIDHPPAAAMRPAGKLARHDETLVLNLMILVGHVPEEPPARLIALVRLDGRFQQFVRLCHAVQSLQRGHGFIQVLGGRHDRFIQQQTPQGLVGIAEIAFVEGLAGLFPPLPCVFGAHGG